MINDPPEDSPLLPVLVPSSSSWPLEEKKEEDDDDPLATTIMCNPTNGTESTTTTTTTTTTMEKETEPPPNIVSTPSSASETTTTNLEEDLSSTKTTPKSTTTTKSTPFTILLLGRLVLQLFLLLCGTLAGSLYVVRHFGDTQFTPLLQRLALGEYDEDLETYPEFQNDYTYYDRQCGAAELLERQPHGADDLKIRPHWTGRQAADAMLSYGAVTMANVLRPDTADELRRYLAQLHERKHDLPYTQVFFNSIDRWSLGLGLEDHPAIGRALREVGRHEVLRTTLEGILGPNPALVELSTLTSMNGAEEQGIHTDSDYFGSSLRYGRTFLHTYSMFIALQDTTDVMGATTICPGSHYCANEDLEAVCLGEYEDEDDDDDEEVEKFPKIAFEVSTNGKIGPDGLFKRGDAFMFNQNIWHRGPANEDPNGTDRTMFILTFASRRDAPIEGDVRRQPLGTYYYQRWNLWSSALYDLPHAGGDALVQPWAALRALGLWIWDTSSTSWRGPQTVWGDTVTYLEQVAQQMANREDFYSQSELKDFQQHLKQYYYPYIPKWMRATTRRGWIHFLQETLTKWQRAALYLNLGAGLSYLVLVGGFGTLGQAMRQVATIYSVLALLFCVAIPRFWIDRSALSKAIASGQLQKMPFPLSLNNRHPADSAAAAASTMEQDLGPTTFPQRQDVLLGTRFDAKFLASFEHFLDYHPGNQLWLEKVRHWAALPTRDLQQQAVTDNLDTDLVLHNIKSRMLKQNPATGTWHLLSNQERWQETMYAVERASNPLVDAWVKQAKYNLAKARFGPHRHTTMERKFGIAAAQEWLKRILGHVEKDESLPNTCQLASSYCRPSDKTGRQSTSEKRFLGRRLLKDTGALTSEFVGSFMSSSIPRASSVVGHNSERMPSFFPNEVVWVMEEEFWYKYTVVRVEREVEDSHDYNGKESVFWYKVRDSDGSHAWARKQQIRPFSPMKQGDRVEVDYLEDGEQYEKGFIQSIHPDGTCSILYDDGEFQEKVRLRKYVSLLVDQSGPGMKTESETVEEFDYDEVDGEET